MPLLLRTTYSRQPEDVSPLLSPEPVGLVAALTHTPCAASSSAPSVVDAWGARGARPRQVRQAGSSTDVLCDGVNGALTEEFPDHPNTRYLREEAIREPLDEWIASITTAEALAEHQRPSTRTPPSDLLNAKLAEVDRKIASLIAAVEAGVNLSQITEQLNRRARERSWLEVEMRALPRQRLLDPAELHQAME